MRRHGARRHAAAIHTTQRAVAYSKYPPIGTRSIGGAFAPYGFGISDSSRYRQLANDEIMIIIQIESAGSAKSR